MDALFLLTNALSKRSAFAQLHHILPSFIHIFKIILSYLIEGCDTQTDGRTQKHGYFYNID